MQIKFLGSGSAWVTSDENFHSNILLTKQVIDDTENTAIEKKLLFDAGHTIQESLKYHNIDETSIDSIFISHLHGDHVAGLEYLGFKSFFVPGFKKIQLVSHPLILDDLWNNVLSGTMRSLNGMRAELETYFDVLRVPPLKPFVFAGVEMNMTRVRHVVTDVEEVPAYGLKFVDSGVKVFITGDTQFDFWLMIGNYEWADIIFHEVEFAEYDGGVHTQFRHLKEIPIDYKKKMWLYHYSLGDKTFEELEHIVLEAGFAGLVTRGQTFDTAKFEKESKV